MRSIRRLALVALLLAGCSAATPSGTASGPSGSPPAGSPAASPATSASTAPGSLTQPALKTRLIDRFGQLWYCDPDFYPLAREDEGALAVARWSEVTADPDALAAITAQLGISLTSPADASDAQKLAIYHEWKMLRAIVLDPVAGGQYGFSYLAMPVASSREGIRWSGTIDSRGAINIVSQVAAPQPNCPICLARGQPIDTPVGPRAVESLRLGDIVWSLDATGNRTLAAVSVRASTAVPAGHQVVRLVLADGRTVIASPGHPLVDGRHLGNLRAGDVVQGVLVTAAEWIDYAGDETFDILAAGATGSYAVNGIWLGSTLAAASR